MIDPPDPSYDQYLERVHRQTLRIFNWERRMVEKAWEEAWSGGSNPPSGQVHLASYQVEPAHDPAISPAHGRSVELQLTDAPESIGRYPQPT